MKPLEQWQKRLGHDIAYRDSLVESGCAAAPKNLDPPGGVCLVTAMKFDGKKFWPIFNAKGHTNCDFYNCSCSKEFSPENKERIVNIMSKNDLSILADAIMKSGEDKKQQVIDFNANLRLPDATMVVGEFPWHYEYGFWRVDDGVVRLRKFSNGYNPWDQRVDYTKVELATLVGLAAQNPVPMDKK